MTLIKYRGLDVDPSKLNETVQVSSSSLGALSLQESDSGESFIMPRIESIHAGRTANSVFYPADKLKGDKKLGSGVYSWTEPYAKPVIYNHDLSTEVTGRVVRAAYSEYTQAGVPGIILVPKITEKSAVEAVRDGRLLTVSIGAETNSAVCSICGTDIINEGYCGHMKGEEYDGHTAEWIVGDLFFQELSWVNQPADSNAFVVDSDVNREVEAEDTKESLHTNKNINEYYGIPKAYALTESVAVNMNEKEDTSEVSNELDKLKKVTQEAKDFLEAIELNIDEVSVDYGKSVVLTNTGDPIPEGATVSVNNELFTVEINEDNEVVLTAPQESEETEFDLVVSVKSGTQTTSVAVPVTVNKVEEDEEETDDPEEDEVVQDETEEDEVEDDDESEEDKADLEKDKTDSGEDDETDDEGDEDPAGETKEGKEEPEGPTGVKGEPGPIGVKGRKGETAPKGPEAKDKKDDTVSEAVEMIQILQGSNQLLNEQVRQLTQKLRESYINKIVDKHDGDLSEEYIERLGSRKLESLEETIEDLESGFLKVKPEEKVKTERKVTKVVNPIKENDKSNKEKEITEQDKINVFKNFLKL